MTIDEAIKDLIYDAQCNRADLDTEWAERNEQLAEWLEELKQYKLGDCMNDCEHYDNCANYIYSKGYNAAIDEFANFLHEKAKENNGLRLSSETRSWTHASIYDYVNEFREQMKTK